MTNSKIDRIEKEMQKTREKISEYQNRLKELAAQKTEALHAPDPRRAYRPAFRRTDPRHCRRRYRLHGTGGNRK